MTSAPTEPPIRAAIKATGSNLLVIIIALLLLAKDPVRLKLRCMLQELFLLSGDSKCRLLRRILAMITGESVLARISQDNSNASVEVGEWECTRYGNARIR